MDNKIEMTKPELFIKLAKPGKNGISRWVDVSEFVGQYSELELLNGFSWGRKSSSFAKKYNVETDKSLTKGPKIDRIRLNGFNTSISSKLTQTIRQDIKSVIAKERCVILGTHTSCDHKTEVDHKDGRKDDLSIMNPKTQRLEDFQPLSKPANDAKRQFCKVCKVSGNRYDAKLLGYCVSVTFGDIKYDASVGCVGCYWYDPLAFNKAFVLKK